MIKSEKIRKKVLFPAGIVFLVIMALLARQQCGYWKNSIALMSHALQVTRHNYLAHNNMGLALHYHGKLSEAIENYNESIRLKPSYAYPYNNRGIIYGELKQYQLAMNDFNDAIRRMPLYADAYYNRGLTYGNLGRHQLAMKDYNHTIRLKPDYTKAYINRGVAYFKQGNKILGCKDARKACALGNCTVLQSADCR